MDKDGVPDDIDDSDDMFADSATTTSDLFGKSTPNVRNSKMMLNSMSSFGGVKRLKQLRKLVLLL